MGEKHHAVADDRVCRFKRRRMVEDEKRDRAESSENHGGNSETHQYCERGLFERKARPENLRKHSVHRAIA